MTWDVHVHVPPVAPGTGVSSSLVLRILRWRAARRGIGPDHVAGLVARSGLDHAVVLALDATWSEAGERLDPHTPLYVSNDEVAALCARHPFLHLGASVHPYRPDALAELERATAMGACLVKWLPSAQGIAPDNPRCIPFYEALVALGLPLLCHTGIEHTLPGGAQDLNHPRRLRLPLERGVTVIAAHCGTRLYLYEPSWFDAWRTMTREFERLYGDTGAFGLPLHEGALRAFLDDPALCGRVLYASDFPALILPTWYAPVLGWARARTIAAEPNPLRRSLELARALGLPDEVFTRAAHLLRLPPRTPHEEVA